MLSQFCHHFNSVQFLEDLPRGGPPLLPLTPPTIKPPSITCLTNSRGIVRVKVAQSVQLSVTPQTVQSMGFSRPEYWNG